MELSFSFENVFPGKHRGRVVELRIQGLGPGGKEGFIALRDIIID